MRGYFAIGAEQISKPMNLGNLIRSAHAFGASFFFTIAPVFAASEVRLSDTSDAAKHLPLYNYDSVGDLALPRGCALIGVELSDDAVELPSFHHPSAAGWRKRGKSRDDTVEKAAYRPGVRRRSAATGDPAAWPRRRR